MFVKNKTNKDLYLVIGLGKSGYWVSKLLQSQGKKIIVIESETNNEVIKLKLSLEKIGVKVFLGIPFRYELLKPWIKNTKLVILSPSIHLDNKTVLKIKACGIKVSGEVNIGWENLKGIDWVGITGTNGKTTVTHLLSHLLSSGGFSAPAAGNIGIPLCKYAYENKKNLKIDWIIAELSSYQIEITNELKPKIGIWTSFTPDHLDRHKTITNYFNIKNKMFKYADIRIYNYDDDFLKSSFEKLKKGIWITSDYEKVKDKKCSYWIDHNGFIVEKGTILFDSKLFKLKGIHNKQNLLLATAAAREIGLSVDIIKTALINYAQLPHRLETIYKNDDVEIINDSKATNFDSSIAGINAIKKDMILISGGRIKDGNHDLWVDTVKQHCHSIFLYGESAKKLKEYLIVKDFKKEIFISLTIKDVIKKIIFYLKKENIKTILFSPACSSFDQFKDFEERGNSFKSLIKDNFC